ncbi:DUF4351 domain-containing protein [Pantanalinema rosaneae CENA516]|uniref:DUF4351 domain-containing protein n=1 Tax=Pantanalinema rosaneae TaxID=1620701 RepID=UPI003D6F779B
MTAGEKYETDLLVKAKVQNQDSFFLIHLEHQAQHQSAFDKRMFRYFARLYEKYDLPIYPIALLSFDSPKTLQNNTHQIKFPNQIVLDFHYKVIQLNQLNWRDFLQYQNPVAAALMAKMNIVEADRLRVKCECLRLLATLRLDRAKMQLISGFVDTYLRLNQAENRLLQAEIDRMEADTKEVIMQIVTSWMEEGLQQGLHEGKQVGRQEEALSLIMRLLNRRIGEIPSEMATQLQQLALLKLKDLVEALLDFSNPNDVENWLQQIKQG